MTSTLAQVLLCVIVGFWVFSGAAAAAVALFHHDAKHAERAFKILLVVARYGLGVTAVAAFVATMGEFGLFGHLPRIQSP